MDQDAERGQPGGMHATKRHAIVSASTGWPAVADFWPPTRNQELTIDQRLSFVMLRLRDTCLRTASLTAIRHLFQPAIGSCSHNATGPTDDKAADEVAGNVAGKNGLCCGHDDSIGSSVA